MTTSTMQVSIVSQEARIYSGSATMLIASGVMGDLGIAPRHAPLLTVLRPGPVRIIKPEGEEEVIYVSGGILEIQSSEVTILADTVVRGAELDEEDANRAKALAEKQILSHHGSDPVTSYGAHAELANAVGMLRTIKEIKRMMGKSRK
jgi:F-type H+-transporting ATPase subunit epsilon